MQAERHRAKATQYGRSDASQVVGFGGDAVSRAVLGQRLDGVLDLGGVLADNDGAAGGGGLTPHPAAAADDQLLPGEDGPRVRPADLVRLADRVLESVPVRVH
jgi:hypothetical protein